MDILEEEPLQIPLLNKANVEINPDTIPVSTPKPADVKCDSITATNAGKNLRYLTQKNPKPRKKRR